MGHPEETPGAVQRLNAAQVGVLDTMTHATDAQGNPLAANMMVNGLEVMTTGSFNMTDTAASLLEEAADKLKELNPFEKGKKGPSEVTLAALDYMEMDPENPADFSGVGQWVAEKIRSINTVVTAVTDTGAEITEGAGELVGSGITDAASTAGGVFGVMSSINEALGGSARLLGRGAAGRRGRGRVGGRRGHRAHGRGGRGDPRHLGVDRGLRRRLGRRPALPAQGLHLGLRARAAEAAQGGGEGDPRRRRGDRGGHRGVDKEIRDYLEEKLGEAWNQTVTVAMQFLNAAIEAIREETGIDEKRHQQVDGPMGPVIKALGGVGDLYENGQPQAGIAPSTYQPPSHTQIAKDHGDIVNPVSDQHADEPGSHDHDDHDEGGAGEAHEGDEHGHTHISSYLAPLAGAMGTKASRAVGLTVSAAWDEVDAGGQPSEQTLAAIDRSVDHWFNHPSTNMEDWRADFEAALRGPRIGAMVYERLSRDRAGR